MNNKERMVHDLLDMLENKPTDEVLTVAYAMAAVLKGYADDGTVDTGYGFGESCLDFWLDDKAVRVIVKPVPALDRESTQ